MTFFLVLRSLFLLCWRIFLYKIKNKISDYFTCGPALSNVLINFLTSNGAGEGIALNGSICFLSGINEVT